MPWCPKCGVEYRPGFFICKDCSEVLSDSPPVSAPIKFPEFKDKPAYLTNVYSDSDADLIASILKEEGIPILKQYVRIGEYLQISWGAGKDINIYVPESSLETAKIFIKSHELQEKTTSMNYLNNSSKAMHMVWRIVLGLILASTLIGLFIECVEILKYLF